MRYQRSSERSLFDPFQIAWGICYDSDGRTRTRKPAPVPTLHETPDRSRLRIGDPRRPAVSQSGRLSGASFAYLFFDAARCARDLKSWFAPDESAWDWMRAASSAVILAFLTILHSPAASRGDGAEVLGVLGFELCAWSGLSTLTNGETLGGRSGGVLGGASALSCGQPCGNDWCLSWRLIALGRGGGRPVDWRLVMPVGRPLRKHQYDRSAGPDLFESTASPKG